MVVEWVNSLPHPHQDSSDSLLDFINKIKITTLDDVEVLVLFDVSSLFPIVHISITLDYISQFVDEHIILASLCVSQNYFILFVRCSIIISYCTHSYNVRLS